MKALAISASRLLSNTSMCAYVGRNVITVFTILLLFVTVYAFSIT